MSIRLSPVDRVNALVNANPESRLSRIVTLRGGAGRVPESTGTERFRLIQAIAVAAEHRQRSARAEKNILAHHLDIAA